MKKLIVALLFFYSFVAISQQSATTTSPSSTGPILAQGIRFSLIKPFFDLTEKLQIKENYRSFNIDYESAGGIGVGYNFLPAGDFGYTTSFAFYEAKLQQAQKSTDSLNFVKAAVNVGFSADKFVSLLAGLNTMKFVNNSKLEDLNLQVGWQVGLNFQINENFSISLFDYKMVTSGLVDAGPSLPGYDKISSEVKYEGYEVELGVTF